MIRKRLKDCFIVFSLTIILGTIFFSVELLLRSLFVDELLIQSVSAFAGAFFAFLFIRLNDFLDKIYQRQKIHYNSLVALETQLNEIGAILNDNIFIFPAFRKVIMSGNVYSNNLHTISIDKTHYGKLYDIDLINKLFSYNDKLRRLNDDIETVTKGYSELKSVLFQTNNINQYKINMNLMAEQLIILEAFTIERLEQTIKLLTRIRCQIKLNTPLGTKLIRKIYSSPEIPTPEDINKEEEKLRKEIEEIREQSKKANEEILQKIKLSK